jgi:ELWxxDGT repeat protein
MHHVRRPGRDPFLRRPLASFLLTACLASAPATAEPADVFPAFATPAGLSGEPKLFAAGDRLFAHVGAPTNRLYLLDRQTLTATSLSDTPLLPLVPAGDRLLVKDLSTQGLVAAGDGLLPLPVMQPSFPVAAGNGGLAWLADDLLGQQIWESDGTVTGTRLLVDLDPAWNSFCPSAVVCPFDLPYQIVPSDDLVYFSGKLPGEFYPDVFSVDRATGESDQVSDLPDRTIVDLVTLPGGGVAYLAVELGLFPIDAYFEAWVYQGGENRRLLSFYPISEENVDYLHVVGDRLLILVRDPPQDQLWSWQPGDASPQRIANFYFDGERPADRNWPVVDGRLYFPATTVIGDTELWSTDGTAEGTRRVADVNPGSVGSNPHDFLALPDGRIVFSAFHRLHGDELFVTDGTAEGTVLLADIAPEYESSKPSDPLLHGNRLFLEAQRREIGAPREYFYLDLEAPPVELDPCPLDLLCLGDDRFRVAVEVETAAGTFAGRREHSDGDSGVFSFFSPGNWEMLVKVLDGCTINDRFWVFSSAATDVEYTLTVTDRSSGETYVHHHEGGSPAPALTDIDAFANCDLQGPVPVYQSAAPGPAAAPVCSDGEALCFGQLRIRVDWETAEDSGPAKASPYGTPESGLFSFFSANNQEMLVKLLDGCAINGHRWLLASAATDVGFTLKVRNSFNPNENRDYHHPGGSPAPAIIDLTSYGAGCGSP